VAADRLGDRPGDATGDELVAGIRRSLLASGGAVLGRATVPAGQGWRLRHRVATPEAPLSKRGGREKDWQRGGLDRTHVDRMTRPRLLS
jgi:hypothetical protein